MSGPTLPRNSDKAITLGSPNLPGGCNPLANSLDAGALRLAISFGNRTTRREALRNLKKLERKGGQL